MSGGGLLQCGFNWKSWLLLLVAASPHGDLDGVLVIPRPVERDVLQLALEKVSTEDKVRTAFEHEGITARAALQKFGVL